VFTSGAAAAAQAQHQPEAEVVGRKLFVERVLSETAQLLAVGQGCHVRYDVQAFLHDAIAHLFCSWEQVARVQQVHWWVFAPTNCLPTTAEAGTQVDVAAQVVGEDMTQGLVANTTTAAVAAAAAAAAAAAEPAAQEVPGSGFIAPGEANSQEVPWAGVQLNQEAPAGGIALQEPNNNIGVDAMAVPGSYNCHVADSAATPAAEGVGSGGGGHSDNASAGGMADSAASAKDLPTRGGKRGERGTGGNTVTPVSKERCRLCQPQTRATLRWVQLLRWHL
jgi:hypothetical protein